MIIRNIINDKNLALKLMYIIEENTSALKHALQSSYLKTNHKNVQIFVETVYVGLVGERAPVFLAHIFGQHKSLKHLNMCFTAPHITFSMCNQSITHHISLSNDTSTVTGHFNLFRCKPQKLHLMSLWSSF